MGKIRRFLHFVTFLGFLFTAGNTFAAGYVCPTSISYTGCDAGYYLSDCGSTYDGHTVTNPTTNNSCTSCPSASLVCDGGAICPHAQPGYYVNGQTAIKCPSDRPLSHVGATSESDCFSAPFSMKTENITANTTVNGMYINAAGSFVVDWGDGTVEQYNIANPARSFLTDGQLLTHTYTTANSAGYTIKIGGTPTAYSNGLVPVAPIFVTAGSRVKEVMGNLATLFPTINGVSPRFAGIFDGNTSLTTVPAGLFSGAQPVEGMFTSIFEDCSNLRTVPSGLFSGISVATPSMFVAAFRRSGLVVVPAGLFSGLRTPSGSTTSEVFSVTFQDCQSLVSVASGAFSNLTINGHDIFNHTFDGCIALTSLGNVFQNVNVTGGNNTFVFTFNNCTSLTTLPVGLFSGMTTLPTMFYETFRGCTQLKNISGVFDGLTGDLQVGLFSGTFHNTAVSYVPDGLFSGISGIPVNGMFGGTFYDCPNLGGAVPRSAFGDIAGLGTNAGIIGFEQTFGNDDMDTTCPANTYKLVNPAGWEGGPAALCQACPKGTYSPAGSTKPSHCVTPKGIVLNKNGIASAIDDPGANWLDLSDRGGHDDEALSCLAGEMVTLPTLESENPEYMFVGWMPSYLSISDLATAMENNDEESLAEMVVQQVECGDQSEYVAIFMRQIQLNGWTATDENTGATGLFGFITIDTPSGDNGYGYPAGDDECPDDDADFCAGVAGRTNAYCLINSYMSLPNRGELPAGARTMTWRDGNDKTVTSSILCENATSEYTALAVGCSAGQYLKQGSCTSCPADKPISQPFSTGINDCIGNVMTIGTTQMAAGDEIAFYISPEVRAVFWVDWGDGTVQDSRYDFSNSVAQHTYTTASGVNGWTIRIGRQDDVLIYPQWENAFAMMVGHEFIKSVSGLSNTFPTIVNGPDEPERHQPLFMDAFAGCENLTTIDSNLFANIRGTARESMFSTMFLDTGLTSIPAGLFSGLSGVAHNDAFNGTFINTQITSIPDGMFAGIDEIGAGTFMFTFAFNEHLNPAAYVPRSMFGEIDGLGLYKIDGFTGFLNDSGDLKQGCPAGMFRLVNPDDSWDDYNVMFCDTCPAGTTTPDNNTLTSCAPICDEVPENATRVDGSCAWTCVSGYYGTSENGDTECTQCPSGYSNGAAGATSINQCQISCSAGSYVRTAKGICIDLREHGYYVGAHNVNYGSVSSTLQQCPTGLTSGDRAASADDCGRAVHIGDKVLYTRRIKHTTPSLNVKVGGITYYADMELDDGENYCTIENKCDRLRVRDADNQLYWVMGQGGNCQSVYRECVEIDDGDDVVPL